jgi:hypothetical protein
MSPLKTGDWLIEVTTLPDLTVYTYSAVQQYFKLKTYRGLL